MDEVRAEVEELDRKAREFFAAVDTGLSTATTVAAPVAAAAGVAPVLVSPELIAAIRDGLRRVQEAHQAALDRFQQFLEQPGDPPRLYEVAETWATLASGLGDTASSVGLDRMAANVEWDGRAAAAYRALVPAQAEHVGTMKTQCLALSTSLRGLADQIDAFWTAMTAAAITMAAGFAVAVVTALTVVGIPAACATILIAIAAGATMVGTAVVQMNALTDRIASEQRDIAQVLREVGDGWPAPNLVPLSDASRTDGDRSDWRPMR
ncbi:hypothetical protein ACQPX6_25115 [Actinomycetospora sp. CA-101289]|uniref:hypothetical protein n=1 Tax=Actinomycetospora sp. CA-101289 TaxID=3239893 RepID=UPI003D953A18